MDEIQEIHERAVGMQFVEWYNNSHGTSYQYVGRADEAPDLIFRYRDELRIEVTDSFYDNADATLQWKKARAVSDAPKRWSGINFDESLVKHIADRIAIKSLKRYGGRCFLLVNVNPPITLPSELEAFIPSIKIPSNHAFAEIYLTGTFPSGPHEEGGYRCWKLA